MWCIHTVVHAADFMCEVLVELVRETESLTSFSFANNDISAESMQDPQQRLLRLME